jgi:hypothetical protein
VTSPGFSRSFDDWKTTEPPLQGGGLPHRAVCFRYACEGLVRAVERAAKPASTWLDDLYHEADAVWFAKHVCGEARRLGLIPPAVDVRVLVEMDVCAGERA